MRQNLKINPVKYMWRILLKIGRQNTLRVFNDEPATERAWICNIVWYFLHIVGYLEV